MTLEDIAFDRIVDFIRNNDNFDLLSAHPPSGKSYFTDLIRIPYPHKNIAAGRRSNIDIIFCSSRYLYLCEVKGIADESDDDILKLRAINDYYNLQDLKRYISIRLTYKSLKLKNVSKIILTIGALKESTHIEKEIMYIIVNELGNLTLKGSLAEKVLDDFKL